MAANRNTLTPRRELLDNYPSAWRRTIWQMPDGTLFTSSSHPAYPVDYWDDCPDYRECRKVSSIIQWGRR